MEQFVIHKHTFKILHWQLNNKNTLSLCNISTFDSKAFLVLFLPPRQLRCCNQKYRHKCWICDQACTQSIKYFPPPWDTFRLGSKLVSVTAKMVFFAVWALGWSLIRTITTVGLALKLSELQKKVQHSIYKMLSHICRIMLKKSYHRKEVEVWRTW